MPGPYLLQGAEAHIATWMGLAPTTDPLTKTAENQFLRQLGRCDPTALFPGLLENLDGRREAGKFRKPSPKNWRWAKQADIGRKNPSAEVRLEKWLVSQPGSAWVNAIPTASGLFDGGGRRANLDLGLRGADRTAFVELKWDDSHPVYAALELAGYATAWVQARIRAREMRYVHDGEFRPALDAKATRWIVLAPPSYFAAIGSQLVALEQLFQAAFAAFFATHLPAVATEFKFVELPPECPDFRGDDRPKSGFMEKLTALIV